MIPRFFVSMIIGFICHQASHVTRKMQGGWRNLTDHTIGMVTITPLILWWWRFLHDSDATAKQIENEITSATGLASIGYGVGNALAWVLDALIGNDE